MTLSVLKVVCAAWSTGMKYTDEAILEIYEQPDYVQRGSCHIEA